MIGNKDDLEDKVVAKSIIDELINKTKFKFRSTSALRADTNIDEIFDEIAEGLIEKYLSIGDKKEKLKLLKKIAKRERNPTCICKIYPET